MRWYITVAAVHEFQRIAGLPTEADGPLFDRAAKELDEICERAALKKDGPTQQYQAKTTIRGKVVRLELYVRPDPRPEGPLPQLVRVRCKGGSRTGKRKDK